MADYHSTKTNPPALERSLPSPPPSLLLDHPHPATSHLHLYPAPVLLTFLMAGCRHLVHCKFGKIYAGNISSVLDRFHAMNYDDHHDMIVRVKLTIPSCDLRVTVVILLLLSRPTSSVTTNAPHHHHYHDYHHAVHSVSNIIFGLS